LVKSGLIKLAVILLIFDMKRDYTLQKNKCGNLAVFGFLNKLVTFFIIFDM